MEDRFGNRRGSPADGQHMKRALLLVIWILAVPAHADPSKSWYLQRGQDNMKIGNYKAAIEAYEKALALDPDDREALRALATAYRQQGLIEKSIEMTDRYLRKYPK